LTGTGPPRAKTGMNTPDTTERRGGIKGRSAPGERTGDSRLQGLRQDGNPLARNGPGQRRRAGSVRSMTAARTPGATAFYLAGQDIPA
ncbi:hypothetical protein ACWXWC_24360, partial [Pantoea dispersa]